MSLAIVPLNFETEPEAVALLARAFVTNPLHVAVFGAGDLAANEAFFRTGLRAMKGTKLAALDGERLLGMVHWVDSPGCQPSPMEKLRLAPALATGLGLRRTLQLLKWLSIWADHEPGSPHVHLGPVGVSPDMQGKGVGRLLMEAYCGQLEQRGAAGYLETDRPENVEFYRKFGFRLAGTAPVHGVPNYFMSRE